MTEMDPTVTVIIPTYNRAHVLSRAIDSVLKQTFSDFELIIVDDGSKDNTSERVARYRDPRIRYIRHDTNVGQNQALNTGLSMARGVYISFLDSDDEWLPEMLARVVEKFRGDADLGCVYTRYDFEDDSGEVRQGQRYDLEGYIYADALRQGYISSPTTLSAKKTCFERVGNFELDIIVGQDDAMCLKLAKEYKFGLIRASLAIMHSDGGNQLTANAGRMAEDSYRVYEKFKLDIIAYCGNKALARHYANSGVLFVNAGERIRALELFCKALRYDVSWKRVLYVFLLAVPGRYFNRMLQLLREVSSRSVRAHRS